MLGQNRMITNAANGTLANVVSFGSLAPGANTTAVPLQTQFRLWSRNRCGYHLDAQCSALTVTPNPGVTDQGGSRIALSDVGIGIAVARGSGAMPGTDSIQTGFNYNPGSVAAPGGVTPYTGRASGQATLADLTLSRTILSGSQIGTATDDSRYVAVTMTLGVVPQYFTPSTFSALITLTIANGL